MKVFDDMNLDWSDLVFARTNQVGGWVGLFFLEGGGGRVFLFILWQFRFCVQFTKKIIIGTDNTAKYCQLSKVENEKIISPFVRTSKVCDQYADRVSKAN